MRRFPALLFLVLAAQVLPVSPLGAQGLEDWYASVSAAAGVDPHAGKTTFLTLVIPPGGMYEAMGTAYSAVVRDSGYLEANPAGSALLKETELSVFHNDWVGDSRLETVVFTLRQNNFGFGFGAKLLYLPFEGIDNWGQQYQDASGAWAKGYYTEFIGTANASYTAFGDYYHHGLTFGANLKVAQRTVPEALAPGQSAVTVLGDAGLLTKFNFLKFYPSKERNLSLAAVAKNLGPPVLGDPVPTEFVAGIAYSPWRQLTLSADLTAPHNLTEPWSPSFSDGTLKLSPLDEQAWGATGLQVAVANFWAVQGGLELKPGRPRLTAGSTVVLEKLTLNFSYTVDLLTTLSVPDRLSVEVKLNLGDLGRQDAEDRARELYLSGLEAYAKGRLEEAILIWNQALLVLPSLVPAREMRDTAQKALDLRKKMEASQKVD